MEYDAFVYRHQLPGGMTGTLKAQLAQSLSDEELLLRYMVPAEDLEATRAAGPLRTDYLFTTPTSVPDLIAHFGELSRTRSVRVTHPEFSLDLTRP